MLHLYLKNGKCLKGLFLLCIFLSVFIPACDSGHSETFDLQTEYARAVADAKVAEPSEVCKDLTAIVPWNSSLVWQGEPGKSRVLVVTWAGDDTYYRGHEGDDNYYLPVNLWVTLAPELKNFFKDRPFSILRLEQALGLPPGIGKTAIIELWAEPADLFRPSPDPEVTDSQAEIDFCRYPNGLRIYNGALLLKDDYDCGQNGDCSYNAYEVWFNHLKANSYSGAQPYPWTRLGYTYDWGNPHNHVGLSEFILAGGKKDGITVGIKSITDTERYFK